MGDASYTLTNCTQRNREHPRTFQIPDEAVRVALSSGTVVKLIFEVIGPARKHRSHAFGSERMWVRVTGRDEYGYVGVLQNDPAVIRNLKHGDPVRFKPEHIAAVGA